MSMPPVTPQTIARKILVDKGYTSPTDTQIKGVADRIRPMHSMTNANNPSACATAQDINKDINKCFADMYASFVNIQSGAPASASASQPSASGEGLDAILKGAKSATAGTASPVQAVKPGGSIVVLASYQIGGSFIIADLDLLDRGDVFKEVPMYSIFGLSLAVGGRNTFKSGASVEAVLEGAYQYAYGWGRTENAYGDVRDKTSSIHFAGAGPRLNFLYDVGDGLKFGLGVGARINMLLSGLDAESVGGGAVGSCDNNAYADEVASIDKCSVEPDIQLGGFWEANALLMLRVGNFVLEGGPVLRNFSGVIDGGARTPIGIDNRLTWILRVGFAF